MLLLLFSICFLFSNLYCTHIPSLLARSLLLSLSPSLSITVRAFLRPVLVWFSFFSSFNSFFSVLVTHQYLLCSIPIYNWQLIAPNITCVWTNVSCLIDTWWKFHLFLMYSMYWEKIQRHLRICAQEYLFQLPSFWLLISIDFVFVTRCVFFFSLSLRLCPSFLLFAFINTCFVNRYALYSSHQMGICKSILYHKHWISILRIQKYKTNRKRSQSIFIFKHSIFYFILRVKNNANETYTHRHTMKSSRVFESHLDFINSLVIISKSLAIIYYILYKTCWARVAFKRFRGIFWEMPKLIDRIEMCSTFSYTIGFVALVLELKTVQTKIARQTMHHSI